MKFKKGQSGNYKGRPVGAIDKDKRKIRDIINTAIEDNANRVHEELSKLKGKAFLDFYIKLLEYGLPKWRPHALHRCDVFHFRGLGGAIIMINFDPA